MSTAPDLPGVRGAAERIFQQPVRCEIYCLRIWALYCRILDSAEVERGYREMIEGWKSQ